MSPDAGSLAAAIRDRIGPVPRLPDWPLVSIVVLNRNGVGLLRRMLAGLTSFTDYPQIELIVVDNGSGDDSIEFMRRVEAPFPISILSNPHNESFSDACNQGAAMARGELLLFLNNDTEPFERGWLRELVVSLLTSEAGAVSSTLVCLDEEHDASFPYGYGVQHRGLAFREEDGMIHPVLHGWEADPLDEHLGRDVERAAVAAACVLVGRDAYERVGGFTHGYVYGAEDVDLCLKLRRAGFDVLCSGRSIVIHHPVSTRRTAPFEEERVRKLANRRILWERWGPQLRREYEHDLLRGDDPGAEAEALGFCLKVADPASSPGLEAVVEALRGRGHRALLLEGDRVEDSLGLNYDVAVDVRGRSRYPVPPPAQLSVLWIADDLETVTDVERSHYEVVLTGREDPGQFADRLLAAVHSRVGAHAAN